MKRISSYILKIGRTGYVTTDEGILRGPFMYIKVSLFQYDRSKKENSAEKL